jgi:hypothetical protein
LQDLVRWLLPVCRCFRVTNCPQIHSRGFHFAFDLDQHPEMGYVLPTWVGDKHLQPTLLESLQSSAVARLLQQQQQQQQQQLALSATSDTDTAALAATADAADLPAGAALSRLLGPSNMTLLHLPLKPGSEDVGQKLAQLRPTLLLFLRQLRCLVLSDAEAGTVSPACMMGPTALCYAPGLLLAAVYRTFCICVCHSWLHVVPEASRSC